MWVAHLKDTLQSSRATKLVLTRRVNLKGDAVVAKSGINSSVDEKNSMS